jgi:hypothetical protein
MPRHAQEIPVRIAMKAGYLAATLHLPALAPPAAGWPAVLMCHGFTGQRLEAHFLFVKASRAFAALGLASLRFDFRGSGESSGRFQDMSVLTELADALAAWEYLGRLRGVDPGRRALLGLSFGGAVAALLSGGLAAEGRAPAGCALWSAVGDLAGVFPRRLGLRGRPRSFPLELEGHLLGRRFFADLARVPRPVEALGAADVPALVVHGGADQSVPVSQAREFHRRARRSRLVILPGYDHTFNHAAWERKVIGLTGRWLAAHL